MSMGSIILVIVLVAALSAAVFAYLILSIAIQYINSIRLIKSLL